MNNSTTKTLIPNKEWLLQYNNQKIGSISKDKKGYFFLKNGKQISMGDLDTVNKQFGITLPDGIQRIKDETENNIYSIYNFPCSSKPFDPIYNILQKLPLFAKSDTSKSRYCAGYYVIKFKKRWVKSFCPKLITLSRYSFYGPYKTENEMKCMLNTINETTKHITD